MDSFIYLNVYQLNESHITENNELRNNPLFYRANLIGDMILFMSLIL